jgi:hypothetical protein
MDVRLVTEASKVVRLVTEASMEVRQVTEAWVPYHGLLGIVDDELARDGEDDGVVLLQQPHRLIMCYHDTRLSIHGKDLQ